MKGFLDLVKDEGDMAKSIRKVLKEKINGFGDTGIDIFLRCVQDCEGWEGIVWFVDARTAEALEKVGLPRDGAGLKREIEESGEKDMRSVFVKVLERAIGVVLKGKLKELRQLRERIG
jgi:hypothetical protein